MQYIIKKIALIFIMAICVSLLFTAGCDPKFDQNGPRAQEGAISSCDKWKVTGSGKTFSNLRFAHDNNTMTVCKSAKYYRKASLVIDLQRPCLFNTIAIVHGPDEFGYTRRLDVAISNDGKKYHKIYEGVGTRKVTYINILSPVSARYVKLTAKRPGHRPWSIAEVYFQ